MLAHSRLAVLLVQTVPFLVLLPRLDEGVGVLVPLPTGGVALDLLPEALGPERSVHSVLDSVDDDRFDRRRRRV
jgi:hypothetical protein